MSGSNQQVFCFSLHLSLSISLSLSLSLNHSLSTSLSLLLLFYIYRYPSPYTSHSLRLSLSLSLSIIYFYLTACLSVRLFVCLLPTSHSLIIILSHVISFSLTLRKTMSSQLNRTWHCEIQHNKINATAHDVLCLNFQHSL